MTDLQVARAYLDAWNARDLDAIIATFADGGTYEDPNTNGPLPATALGNVATPLWAAFPDLTFEIVRLAAAGPNTVVFEWRMKGTNTAPFRDLPPSGKTIDLPGVDLIVVEGAGIRSVRGYFDGRQVPQQLGLNVLIQPFQLGPFGFGNTAQLQSGKRVKPGAFSITQIMNVDDAEVARTRAMTIAVMKEMASMEGFIGVLTGRIGMRGVTITAWEHPDHAQQVLHSKEHGAAMRAFFSEFRGSAYTSVWSSERFGATYISCASCTKVSDYEKRAGTCTCGAPLPEPAPYW